MRRELESRLRILVIRMIDIRIEGELSGRGLTVLAPDFDFSELHGRILRFVVEVS